MADGSGAVDHRRWPQSTAAFADSSALLGAHQRFFYIFSFRLV